MMDPKRLAMLQEEQGRQAAMRSGKGSGTRLLDDVDQNIGNSSVFQPQMLAPGQYYTTKAQSLTNNSRLLNLTAQSKSGQSITVVMTVSRIVNTPGWIGPITGIIEFGNGSETTRIEFDIPPGPYIGSIIGTDQAEAPHDSGAVIQVPTGVVRAFVRYDNAFLTPELGGYAFGGVGSPFPIAPLSGPFAPNSIIDTPPNQTASPIKAKAFANYFGRHHSKLYKTQYVYCGNANLPVSFYYDFGGGNIQPALYCIPPFAKSVQLERVPQTAAIKMVIFDQLPSPPPFAGAPTLFERIYDIPSGIAPVIPIQGNDCLIGLLSADNTNANKVSAVKLVYEIGF